MVDQEAAKNAVGDAVAAMRKDLMKNEIPAIWPGFQTHHMIFEQNYNSVAVVARAHRVRPNQVFHGRRPGGRRIPALLPCFAGHDEGPPCCGDGLSADGRC